MQQRQGGMQAQSQPKKSSNEPADLKTFKLQSYVHANTLKSNIDGNKLQLAFKVDTKVNCNVRVSCCVTEEKNEMNSPVMFYTPNRDDYVQNVNLMPGMK